MKQVWQTAAGRRSWHWQEILWEQQTPLIATALSSHGQHRRTTSLTVPATSPTHFTNAERSCRRCSERRSTSCGVPVLRGSMPAPAPPSCSPVGSFYWNMGGKQNSRILLLKGACVCESTKIPRVGKKGVPFPKYRLTACKSWFSWCEGFSWSSNLSQNHMGTTFLLLCCISMYKSPSTPKCFTRERAIFSLAAATGNCASGTSVSSAFLAVNWGSLY